jgi:hypothetical protein
LEVTCDLHIDAIKDSIHAAPAISRPLLEGVKKAHPYLAKLDNAEITANRNGASRPTPPYPLSRARERPSQARRHPGRHRRISRCACDRDLLRVVLNIWTNYINEVAKADIEFPWSPPVQRTGGPPLT